MGFYVTNLSGQQRDLQLYVESEPHRGVKFCHQKYNPLTPWWNERGSNPRLSGRGRALNPLSHQVVTPKRLGTVGSNNNNTLLGAGRVKLMGMKERVTQSLSKCQGTQQKCRVSSKIGSNMVG